MGLDNENRKYKRAKHLNCIVKISADGKKYKDGDARDISSGGMGIITEDKYKLGDKLFFELIIQGFMSEFDAKVEGEVVRIKNLQKQTEYGIKFYGLSEDMKIRIDENIANVMLSEERPYTSE